MQRMPGTARQSRPRAPGTVLETPCTSHRARATVHEPPCTSHRARATVHEPPCTSHRAPDTVHEPPCTRHRARATVHPTPCTSHRAPDTVRPTPCAIYRASVTARGSPAFIGGPRDRQPEAGRRRRAAQVGNAGGQRRRVIQAGDAGRRRRQGAQAGDRIQTGTRDARSPVEGGGASQPPTGLPRPKKDEGHSVTATSRELVRMPERRGGGDADRGPEAAKRRAPLAWGHAAGHSNQSVLTTLERSRS
jgi:hypothetical protein